MDVSHPELSAWSREIVLELPRFRGQFVFGDSSGVSVALFEVQDGPELERTPWGAPDLRGIWDFRTITPLERPEELGEQERFGSAEAAAEFE